MKTKNLSKCVVIAGLLLSNLSFSEALSLKQKILPGITSKNAEQTSRSPESCPDLSGNWKGTCNAGDGDAGWPDAMVNVLQEGCYGFNFGDAWYYTRERVSETRSSSDETRTQTVDVFWSNDNVLKMEMSGSKRGLANQEAPTHTSQFTNNVSIKLAEGDRLALHAYGSDNVGSWNITCNLVREPARQ